VPKKGRTEDLSVEELRRLLVQKRRGIRQERLERFRRTGRVIMLASDSEPATLENMRSSSVAEEADVPKLKSRSKRLADGVLLAIEVTAVLGLLFVLFNGLDLIRQLNKEATAYLVQPTFTPTPLIVAVVLPSGHTPPNSPGGARPNEAEIPEHLRPLVQSLETIPLPTPGPQHATRIQIQNLGVDAPIVLGDGWEQLKKGVGQHVGSVNPGNDGNLILTAHNDVFGEIFRDLDKLKPGDEVQVYTSQKVYTYVVTGTKIVEPDEVSVMAQGKDAVITLISCYPYMVDKQRIVVTAALVNSGQ
jgi:sortase A